MSTIAKRKNKLKGTVKTVLQNLKSIAGARKKRTRAKTSRRVSQILTDKLSFVDHLRALGHKGVDSLLKYAPSLISRVRGLGKYTIGGMSMDSCGAYGPPKFVGPEHTIMEHREYIGNIAGSTSFVCNQYAVNPTNPACFPWLSSIAGNFEEYEFLGILFEYRSTSAVALNSTNTALGTVIMSAQYNVHDDLFVNKSQMENRTDAVSVPPSQSVLFPLECKPGQSLFGKSILLTNSNTTDASFNTFANFSIATEGMQAAATIGELWVTYKVKFMKPKVAETAGMNDYWHYRANGTSITNSVPIGTNGVITAYGAASSQSGDSTPAFINGAAATVQINYGCYLDYATNHIRLYFPKTVRTGAQYFVFAIQSNLTSGAGQTAVAYSGCSTLVPWHSTIAGVQTGAFAVTDSGISWMWANVVQITGLQANGTSGSGPAYIDWTFGSLVSNSASGLDVYVIPMHNDDLNNGASEFGPDTISNKINQMLEDKLSRALADRLALIEVSSDEDGEIDIVTPVPGGSTSLFRKRLPSLR